MGHKISGEFESKIDFRYTLIEETEAPESYRTMALRKSSTGTSTRLVMVGRQHQPANFGPLFENQGAVSK